MKIKVSETTKTQLDWLVLKANGAFYLHLQSTYGTKTAWVFLERDDEDPERVDKHYLADCSASTDWNIGGPIIEREKIDLNHYRLQDLTAQWDASIDSWDSDWAGPTPLIAAMRCFVASKLGDEVEVPDELGGAQ